MPRSRIFGFGRVNLIKKVKVDGEWKFCPAVVEQGKKLNDLVRVRGDIEPTARARTTSNGGSNENADANPCAIAH